MIVSINQPAFLPWLGYYDRIYQSDLAVVLDHVQFEKGSFTNRNKIRSVNAPVWLTVPLVKKGASKASINSIEINNSINWQKKQLETVRQSYSRSSFFNQYFDDVKALYTREYQQLNTLLRESNQFLVDALSINTPLLNSSEMEVSGSKSDLVLNICNEVNATTYISGPYGRDYLDLNKFKESGIDVVFHEYEHPTYPQLYDGFEPYMSVIDLLFNCGCDSLKVLSNQY